MWEKQGERKGEGEKRKDDKKIKGRRDVGMEEKIGEKMIVKGPHVICTTRKKPKTRAKIYLVGRREILDELLDR